MNLQISMDELLRQMLVDGNGIIYPDKMEREKEKVRNRRKYISEILHWPEDGGCGGGINMDENKTNCPNCGAPLSDGKCEYCGTESTQKKKELKYFYMGREIKDQTEEMLCDPHLLVTFV